jgi:WD40 repeat protein
MIKMKRQLWFVTLFLSISGIFLAGCGTNQEQLAAQPASTSIATASPTATQPSIATPTATITPTSTPTPTPPLELPVLEETAFPKLNVPIAVENVSQVVELARYGKATPGKVFYSPDGKTLAVFTSIGVYFYDVQSLSETRLIKFKASVEAVSFSSDWAIMALRLPGGIVEIRQVADEKLLLTLETQKKPQEEDIENIQYQNIDQVLSPDGKILAVSRFVSQDGKPITNSVKLWCIPDGTLLNTLDGGTNAINVITFSPDGTILATGDTKTVRLWQVSDGTLLRTLELGKPVEFIAFSLDGMTLISGYGFDKLVNLWSVNDGKFLRALRLDANYSALAISPDGTILAVSYGNWENDNTSVGLWQMSDGKLLRMLEGHTISAHSLAFSPDGVNIATSSSDGTVKLWQISDGQLINTLGEQTGPMSDLAISPEGLTLASGYWDGTVKLLRASDGQTLYTLKDHTTYVFDVTFSPDGTMVATGSGDKTVKLWQVSDGKLLSTLKGHTSGVTGVAFSPDGFMLVSASEDGSIKVWQMPNGQLLQELNTGAYLCSVVFSPDGKILAAGSENPKIRLWQVSEWKPLPGPFGLDLRHIYYSVNGTYLCYKDVAFSPDNTILAMPNQEEIGRWQAPIGLWRILDGAFIRNMEGRNSFNVKLAFSPDGTILASGMKLWQVSDRKLVRTLDVPGLYVAFTSDGTLLATGSNEGVVHLWGIGP